MPFLPLYVVETMTRSFVSGSGGDVISYHLELRTFAGVIEGLRYARPEEPYELFLALNGLLALVYAALIGYAARALVRRLRSRGSAH